MQPRTTPQAPQKPSGARPGRPAASDEIRKRRRSLARSLAIAAAACVAYLPVDLTWEHGKAIVAWRLSWIGVLACAAVGQLRWSARMASAAVHAAAAMSGVATVAIFQLAGGSAHPAFGFVLALPLAVQVLAPDYVWAGLLTGLITGVGGAATLVADGRSAREVGEWMLISAALSALAATGAASFRRLWLKELRVERERNAALERLVTVERLATVGQLAAGVAHEVNNPLSYVNANVQFAVQNWPPKTRRRPTSWRRCARRWTARGASPRSCRRSRSSAGPRRPRSRPRSISARSWMPPWPSPGTT